MTTAASSLVKGNAPAITTNLNTVPGFVSAVQPNGSNPTETTPQAYLTILFFDERFNFIEAADGGVAQQRVAASITANGDVLVRNDIKAPKNGYAYAYVSNQSNLDVYFDNLKVQVVTGNIIEENHYYAYGLKIAAISSKKLGDTYEGTLKNNYLYQGAYSEMDDDIGWNDFELRNYDPQIGRWVQQDPYQQFASPYLGMGNDPVNNTDPSGGVVPIGGGLSTTATTAITLGEVVIHSISHASKASAFITLSRIVSITSMSLNIAISAANVINNSINTIQVGDRALIFARGSADAILNANTLGLTDFFGSTSNFDKYSDVYDQEAYLQGRLAGDAFVMAQSVAEIEGGIGAGGSLAIASGGTSIVAGGAVALHGAAVGLAATSDAAWATAKLLKLNISTKTSRSSSESTPTNGETNATKVGRDAHNGYNPAGNYTVDRRTNTLDNGLIPDAIDIKNRIIRELKPNNYRAIRGGLKQLSDYIKQLEKQYKGTKGKWKRVVDTYEVLPNGKIKYDFNTPK